MRRVAQGQRMQESEGSYMLVRHSMSLQGEAANLKLTKGESPNPKEISTKNV